MSIQVQNITKTFGSFTALRDVSLEAPQGQLMALLGPSGSGKTTLLRIIAGLEFPDRGSVRFEGRDVAAEPVGRRQVGFVFQHYALFRHMSVFENIAFGLRVRPRATRPSSREIRQKVRQLLELIQLPGLENRYPAQLSGGQRQRVALARALAIEPKVLLLDEPFGALDARVREDLRRWLRRLHDELHVTSVLVTHDQEEALEVADRVVVMNQGAIEQIGTPDEVFHRPASAFVMQFLGNVNLFHGRIENGKGRFGDWIIDQAGSARDAKAAKLMVRPHELEIRPQPNGQASIPARITRIQSAGSLVRIELKDSSEHPLLVEVPHVSFAASPYQVGQQVYVQPRQTRIFAEDYSI